MCGTYKHGYKDFYQEDDNCEVVGDLVDFFSFLELLLLGILQ